MMHGSRDSQILVVNGGGGSLRVAVFDGDAKQEVTSEYLDWTKDQPETKARNHAEAMQAILAKLDTSQVSAIGHRVVHGGNQFTESVRIDDRVRGELERLVDLAPLHNRPALQGMRAIENALPNVPQVAVFDTAFHRTLAPAAFIYPIPYSWYERWGVRRFGFHGLSHAYCAERATALLGKDPATFKLVNCHLGSGCSLAAIEGGRSVATTMGFTPLEGLMMATRSGSVDPGLLLHVQRHEHLGADELEQVLNHESGLKGITGTASDMRDVLEARRNGDTRAALAFAMYTLRVREGIGAMMTHLGGIDAISFTDGVGEHVPEVREAILEPLEWLGIKLDHDANRAAQADVDVAAHDSRIHVLVLRAREELMVARETQRILAESHRQPFP